MSRVVLEVLGPSTGGIRRHVAALARDLPGHGWTPTIAGPAHVMDGLVDDGVATLDVPATFGDVARRPDRTVRAGLDLRRLARPATLVHAHGLKAALVALGARPKVPLVVTVHNVVLDEVAGRGAAALRRVERAVVARADHVICGSEEIEAHLRGWVRPERLSTITPAVPDPVARRAPAQVRRDLHLAADAPLVVAVARLHPQKDLGLLIRAFATVSTRHPTAQLVVVGEGPQRRELEALVASLGVGDRVHLRGVGEHPADELAAADVVALSSSWEGVPLVAAEALMLGRPLVMTAVGTIGRRMAADGRGGTAVPVGDEAAFAAALDAALRDPDVARAAGVVGRTVGEHYRAKQLVAAVAAVYGEVAG